MREKFATTKHLRASKEALLFADKDSPFVMAIFLPFGQWTKMLREEFDFSEKVIVWINGKP